MPTRHPRTIYIRRGLPCELMEPPPRSALPASAFPRDVHRCTSRDGPRPTVGDYRHYAMDLAPVPPAARTSGWPCGSMMEANSQALQVAPGRNGGDHFLGSGTAGEATAAPGP